MKISLGILETKGYAAALSAAEIILEDTSIEISKVERTGGGIISVFFKGESDKLKIAFEKGIQKARTIGEIISVCIIPQLNNNINLLLFESTEKKIHSPIPSKAIEESILKPKPIVRKKLEVQSEKQIKTAKEKIKPIEKPTAALLPESLSTIQRLRQEALSSVKPAKHKPEKVKHEEEINLSKLTDLNVHQLRKFARGVKDFPIQGRQISKANRQELMEYLKEMS
jgi:microcompartment protein CcmL/EutN